MQTWVFGWTTSACIAAESLNWMFNNTHLSGSTFDLISSL
eukprot:gene6419-4626_t